MIAGDYYYYFFFFTPKGGDYLREGDYSRETIISKFEIILLTGSCSQNILFYYLIKSKNYHIK